MKNEAEQFEKIAVKVFPGSQEASRQLAREVAELIAENDRRGRPTVLGLATGSTPVPLYRELVRLHREEGLSFKRVQTFNLDEYYGLPEGHPESYYRFMRDQLYSLVDFPEANIHMPPGHVPREAVYSTCADYERRIQEAGGIDLQILGIGRTGHIGFNEPGSPGDSRTRLITLDPVTRRDAARDFLGEENVPRFAITMGVATILDARRVVLMAWGENKAEMVAKAVEGPVTEKISASFLQQHPNASFYVDPTAASALTRLDRPWLAGQVAWTPRLIRKGVTWLAGRVERPVLKLLDEDYEHGLTDLLTDHGPAYQLNIQIFNQLQHTITGWPGGKPDADDADRPERAQPYPKRVLVLSPEPLDEIQGMGGTLHRLAEQNHDVRVGFLTSGSLAVSDDVLRPFLGTLQSLASREGKSWNAPAEHAQTLLDALDAKGRFGEDTTALRAMKALMRREEARAACGAIRVVPGRLHFLELPFYEVGRYRRFQPGLADADRLSRFVREYEPHQIYMTGHVADPSSVQGVCYRIFRDCLETWRKESWLDQCRVWLYRSHERRLQVHEIDMAVPMTQAQLNRKLAALRHYSKSDLESAAAINRDIAVTYDRLGMAEYEAIEAFERLQLSH